MTYLAGQLLAGNTSADGEIVGLEVRVEQDAAALAWAHDGIDPEETGHVLAVAIDGDLVEVLPAGSATATIAGLTAGEHRALVVPIRPETARIPDLHGADYGRRAWISWDASADEDARSYVVYGDNGTGTIDTDTALAVVDEIDVHPIRRALPTSGTGAGRVTIEGSWTGEATNKEFTVTIEAGAATFTHDLTGSPSTPAPFAQGSSHDLGFGVVLYFDSPLDLYNAGDEYAFRVGPSTSWSSEELDEGTYQYQVAARDAAGNESAPIAAASVAIIHRPGPVTGLTAAWDGTDIELAWTLPADEDLDAVLVYASESKAFGVLRDQVIESGPWAALAADAEGHTFTPATAGLWRFLVRTRDSAGRVSESAEVVTVDTTAAPTSVALREPEAVAAIPIAAGAARVSWQYPWQDGGDVTEFRIYVHATATPSFASPLATVAAVQDDQITSHSWDSEALAGTRWFTVRASDGTHETGNVDVHQVVPDSTAPAFSGGLKGVAN